MRLPCYMGTECAAPSITASAAFGIEPASSASSSMNRALNIQWKTSRNHITKSLPLLYPVTQSAKRALFRLEFTDDVAAVFSLSANRHGFRNTDRFRRSSARTSGLGSIDETAAWHSSAGGFSTRVEFAPYCDLAIARKSEARDSTIAKIRYRVHRSRPR